MNGTDWPARWRMEGLLLFSEPGATPTPGALEAADGTITALGPELPPPHPDTVRLDRRGMLALPGYIQAHVHLCQTLFQGLAEGLRLDRWLKERIWPLEAAHDPESLRASVRLGAAEALLHGATTMLDMGTVAHTDVIAETVAALGVRAILGKALMDGGEARDTPLREEPGAALREALALHDRWHGGAGGRLGIALAPRFTLSVSAGLWREIAQEARRRAMLVHTHVSETAWENETCRALHGETPVRALARWGVLEGPTALVHAIRIDAEERALLARHAAGVVHCPGSNAKLGSGVAELGPLLEAGVPVGLGSDGAACNDALSLPAEMRLAAQLQALAAGPGRVGPREIFTMATSGGARVLGLDAQVGTLEVGKRADLVLYPAEPLAWPADIPLEDRLVFGAPAARPAEVYVDGRPRVLAGALVDLDLGELQREAQRQRQRLLARLERKGER